MFIVFSKSYDQFLINHDPSIKTSFSQVQCNDDRPSNITKFFLKVYDSETN